jgi:hypothetical protein
MECRMEFDWQGVESNQKKINKINNKRIKNERKREERSFLF